MEAVVLHRVGFLAYFCPKQGQDFKPSAAPLYPNMGQVPPRAMMSFMLILGQQYIIVQRVKERLLCSLLKKIVLVLNCHFAISCSH